MKPHERCSLKRIPLTAKIILGVLLLLGTTGATCRQELPVFDGQAAVAMVNGEPISLEEFNKALAASHAQRDKEKKPGRIDYSEILQRLINIRVILMEAGNIGIDELPEIKKAVDNYSREALIETLLRQQVENVEADAAEVERLHKKNVKEWKIKSIRFEKEDDAQKTEQRIKAGGDFDEIAKKLMAEEAAEVHEQGDYLKDKDLLPQIAEAVSQMDIGSVSPIIPVATGFVILKLEEERFPEDPEARERARQEALKLKRRETLEDFAETLKERYVKLHPETIEGLDYESQEPGVQALLQDQRIIAEVQGEEPLTVGELTEALQKRLYHGIERESAGKKLNKQKDKALEEILHKRIFRKESLKQGIDQTELYRDMVKEYKNSLIFGTFIEKVVIPEIKGNEEELQTYYQEHLADYSSPEMMRIQALVFAQKADAESNIEKLRTGTNFQWLQTHAQGQVDEKTENVLKFEGKTLTTKSLPKELQEVVSGAKTGDFTLYTSPEGHFYVLFIQEVVPSQPSPFPAVREGIIEKIFNEKIKEHVEDWADKLRKVSEVKIYLKEPE